MNNSSQSDYNQKKSEHTQLSLTKSQIAIRSNDSSSNTRAYSNYNLEFKNLQQKNNKKKDIKEQFFKHILNNKSNDNQKRYLSYEKQITENHAVKSIEYQTKNNQEILNKVEKTYVTEKVNEYKRKTVFPNSILNSVSLGNKSLFKNKNCEIKNINDKIRVCNLITPTTIKFDDQLNSENSLNINIHDKDIYIDKEKMNKQKKNQKSSELGGIPAKYREKYIAYKGIIEPENNSMFRAFLQNKINKKSKADIQIKVRSESMDLIHNTPVKKRSESNAHEYNKASLPGNRIIASHNASKIDKDDIDPKSANCHYQINQGFIVKCPVNGGKELVDFYGNATRENATKENVTKENELNHDKRHESLPNINKAKTALDTTLEEFENIAKSCFIQNGLKIHRPRQLNTIKSKLKSFGFSNYNKDSNKLFGIGNEYRGKKPVDIDRLKQFNEGAHGTHSFRFPKSVENTERKTVCLRMEQSENIHFQDEINMEQSHNKSCIDNKASLQLISRFNENHVSRKNSLVDIPNEKSVNKVKKYWMYENCYPESINKKQISVGPINKILEFDLECPYKKTTFEKNKHVISLESKPPINAVLLKKDRLERCKIIHRKFVTPTNNRTIQDQQFKNYVKENQIVDIYEDSDHYYMQDLKKALNTDLEKYPNYFLQLFKSNFEQNYENLIYMNNSDKANHHQNKLKASQLKPISFQDIYNTKMFPPDYSKNTIPNSDRPKKLLILDLDETIIHCKCADDAIPAKNLHDKVLRVREADGTVKTLYLYYRPYMLEFLQSASKYYNIVIWAGTLKSYAKLIIDTIDTNRKYIDGELFREHCLTNNAQFLVKDLSIIKERDPSQIVMVDNSVTCFLNNIDNGVPIIPYYDNKDDKELLKLLKFLIYLSGKDDVRSTISQKFELKKYILYQKEKDLVEALFTD